MLVSVLTVFTGQHGTGPAAAASLDGMHATFIAAALISLAGAVGALFLPRLPGPAAAAAPMGH